MINYLRASEITQKRVPPVVNKDVALVNVSSAKCAGSVKGDEGYARISYRREPRPLSEDIGGREQLRRPDDQGQLAETSTKQNATHDGRPISILVCVDVRQNVSFVAQGGD